MKRCFILAAMLTLVLAACNIDTQVADDSDVSDDTASVASEDPSPTPEPEPTSTPIPTPEPTSTPVPEEATDDDDADDTAFNGLAADNGDEIDDDQLEEIAGDIDVQLRDRNYRMSSFGTLTVFGELENHGDGHAEIREILITLRNDDGSVMDAASAHTFVSVVGPGEVIPFRTSFTDADDSFAEIEIEVEARDAREARFVIFERYREFETLQADWRAGEWSNSIVGEIENVGEEAADLVQVFAVGYDADGSVQFVETTFAERDTMRPGARSPFTIDYLDDELEEPHEIRVLAEGWVVEE